MVLYIDLITVSPYGIFLCLGARTDAPTVDTLTVPYTEWGLFPGRKTLGKMQQPPIGVFMGSALKKIYFRKGPVVPQVQETDIMEDKLISAKGLCETWIKDK